MSTNNLPHSSDYPGEYTGLIDPRVLASLASQSYASGLPDLHQQSSDLSAQFNPAPGTTDFEAPTLASLSARAVPTPQGQPTLKSRASSQQVTQQAQGAAIQHSIDNNIASMSDEYSDVDGLLRQEFKDPNNLEYLRGGKSQGFNSFLPDTLLSQLRTPFPLPFHEQIHPQTTAFQKDRSSYLDVELIIGDFPILRETVNGRPLVWLYNAATTQKPNSVIERIKYFYEHENSNIHRAAHDLAARATDAYEGAREKVREFLNAKSVNEIVFVRGATEAINLVAQSFGRQHLKEGDEIILSLLEHHANIVPWQLLAKEIGFRIRVIPVDDDGQLILEEYQKLFTHSTKLVSFTHVSNALGTITDAKKIIEIAHANGAKVLLDGAQSVSHLRVNLQQLNPDFFVFSGHKVFGPTGIGVLYAREDLLNSTQLWQGGGNMIKDVTFEHTQFQSAPNKFEAGTGNIADAVGLGAAIDYVSAIGMDLIDQHEHQLLSYALKKLADIPRIRLIGTAKEKASVISFVIPGLKTEQIGSALNREGIAVRSGHHCAQPILRRFGVESSVRPSIAFYNNFQDIDKLVNAVYKISEKSRH